MQAAARVGRSVHEAVKQAMEASEELAKLLAAHPDDASVLKLQASVLGNLEKNPGAAERVLERITRIAPRDAGAWGLLGSFYLDSQRIEEGIRCFENAASIDSANPLYRAGLARGYAAANRPAEAQKAFTLALETTRPESNPLVFLWYGDFLAAEARYEESGKAYSRVIATDPLDPAAWLKRAAAEVKAGRYHDAEKDAREALELGAGEREAQSLLLTVYRELGDEAKARTAADAVERASDAEEESRAKWHHARANVGTGRPTGEGGPILGGSAVVHRSYRRRAGLCRRVVLRRHVLRTHGRREARRASRSGPIYVCSPNRPMGTPLWAYCCSCRKETRKHAANFEEALRLDPASTDAKDALNSLAALPK